MYKKKALCFFVLSQCALLIMLASYLFLAYKADPLYLYYSSHGNDSLPTDTAIFLHGNMRLQAAGIINVYDFDSIILGTSMLENTSSAYCNKIMGGTFVNISLAGSGFYERAIVLGYALKRKSIKKIIYSMDAVYLNCLIDDGVFPLENWEYLYRGIKPAIVKYLEREYVFAFFRRRQLGRKMTPDKPCAWFEEYRHRFGGLDNWIVNQNKAGTEFLRKTVQDIAKKANITEAIRPCGTARENKAKQYIEDNIFHYAALFPETEFYLVFPPYSRFEFARWRQVSPQWFYLHQQIIRYVVDRAAELGNVFIYGFEDCKFVEDIANYKDTTHYHPQINEYIIDSIASGKHLLTSRNVTDYLRSCDELALKFDIPAFAADVKKRLDAYHRKNPSSGQTAVMHVAP